MDSRFHAEAVATEKSEGHRRGSELVWTVNTRGKRRLVEGQVWAMEARTQQDVGHLR